MDTKRQQLFDALQTAALRSELLLANAQQQTDDAQACLSAIRRAIATLAPSDAVANGGV